MARLIDADKLEAALHDLMERRGIRCWMSTVFDAVDFETLIDEAPTVDYVKRGAWIDGMPYVNSHWRVCSVCKEPAWHPSGGGDYCPNCGANMKEEENDG